MRRKSLRAVLLIAIFASLGGITYKVVEHFWLMKAREIQKDPRKLLDYVPEAALQIKDFRRAKVEGGRKVWELFGAEARYLKAEEEAVIKKPRFIFYSQDGKTIEATGDQAHLFFHEKEMEKMQLLGEVQVSYQGFVLQTEEALYLKGKEQVLLPGKVSVKGDGLELEGMAMEISLQDDKIRLNKKVKTKLQPEQMGNKRSKSDGKKETRP